MNAGAFIASKEEGESTFIKTVEKARHFSELYGYKFVKIDTNILDFIPYWQMEWHGVVNGSIILYSSEIVFYLLFIIFIQVQ